MRTREESLEIIRNALGGNISTGSPAGKRVRTRDDSLRILQSAVTEPAPSVILNREAVKNPVNRTPGAENDSPMFPNDVGATLAVARPNGSPTGEPWIPQPAAPTSPLSGEPSGGDDYGALAGIMAPWHNRNQPAPQSSPGGAAVDSGGFSGTSGSFAKSEAQIELERLKPVLEEAKQLQNERDRTISGAMRDPARASSAQTRLDDLLGKNGYSSIDELNDAVIDYTIASGGKLTFGQTLDRTVFSGDWWKNILSGGAEQWYGSQLNGAGTMAGNVESIGREGTGMVYENELRARNDWATTLEEAKTGVIKMDAEGIAEIEKILDYYDNTLLPSLRSGVQAYETLAEDSAQAADEITAKGQQNTEKAKEGLGWGGKLAVDVLTQGTMMALDKATVTPSIFMFTRGFGSGAQEARQAGATAQEQIGYGAAVGTVEALTEKLFDGLAGIYGKGAADELVEATIAKLAKSRAGQTALRLLASSFNEGMEEILSDAVNPLLRTVYSGKSVKEEYSGEQLSQWLYDGLVGAIMGTGLTAVNPGTYAFNPGKPQVSAEQENTGLLLPAEGKTQAPQPGIEQKNTAPEEAESTRAVSNDIVRKLKDSIPDIQQKPIVSALSGNEFAKGERKLTEQVGDFFKSLGNRVFRKGFGSVIIDERSVKNDIAHGLGRAKAVTFAAVPDVIASGKQIDFQENWKGRGYNSYVFAAPVKIGDQTNYVAAVVLSDSNNRFYLHEVVDENGNLIYKMKTAPADIKTGVTAKSGITGAGEAVTEATASNNSIAQNGENSNGNPQPSTETGNTGERSSKGSPSGGAVERSKTEGGTTAAEATAKTDPAAAALQQQYQMEIAAALRAGNYQQALKLFKEFGNPNLRALNDFQTLKAFGDFANAAGVFGQETSDNMVEGQKEKNLEISNNDSDVSSLKHSEKAIVDNLLSAKYNFRTIKGKHDIVQDIGTRKMPTCNPNFSKGGDFANNCGYCCTAFEMRRRGCDVIANPQNTMLVTDWLRLFENTETLDLKSRRLDALLNELNVKLSSMEDGARGSLFVRWKGRQVGHFFSWEVKDGKVLFIDAQNGNMDAVKYFNMICPDSVICVRWDNLNPTDLIKDACKNRGGTL